MISEVSGSQTLVPLGGAASDLGGHGGDQEAKAIAVAVGRRPHL